MEGYGSSGVLVYQWGQTPFSSSGEIDWICLKVPRVRRYEIERMGSCFRWRVRVDMMTRSPVIPYRYAVRAASFYVAGLLDFHELSSTESAAPSILQESEHQYDVP